MKVNRLGQWVVVVAIVGGGSGVRAAPLGTGFLYQGQLKEGGAPLDGTADFQFSLWDAAGSGNPPTGGTQIGARQAIDALSVTAGLFTVALNVGGEFGGDSFNGSARWLQIAVRSPAGGNERFTTLAPRQPLTAAPHALFALNAASATNANLLDNLDSTAFLQSIPIPLTLSGASAPHIIRAENTSTGLLPLAVYGRCTAATVGSTGVRGESASTSGRGVYGYASALSGDTYGVMGDVNSPTGYAGYFVGGRNYFEGNVGIGTGSPERALDVVGRIRLRQDSPPSGGNSAGIDFYQQTPAEDRAFIGMQDDDHVGFYGRGGAGWGLTMDVDNGNVGIGQTNPTSRLDVATSAGGNALSVTQNGTGRAAQFYVPDNSTANGIYAVTYGGGYAASFEAHEPNATATVSMFKNGNAVLRLIGGFGAGTAATDAPLAIVGNSDSEPGGGGLIVAGSVVGANLSIDANEIMARNNGATSTLYLNNDGGDVVFGGAIDIGYQRVSTSALTAGTTAYCPIGKRVLGGGCSCSGLASVYESYPNETSNGWTCVCSFLGVEAFAICARVK